MNKLVCMSSRLFLVNMVLLLTCLGCDQIGEDVQPTQEETIVSDNELLTLPDSPLAINLKAFSDPQVATTFRLNQLPKSGTVSFTQKGLLLYTPDQSFVAGADEFSISSDAAVSGKALPPLNFEVSMAPDADALPCSMGVAGDQAETVVNTPITINVLQNDMFCNGSPDPTSLQIDTPPPTGSVRILNEQVVYTPALNFTGRERFIYRVCPVDGTEADCLLSVATVTVTEAVTACQLKLQNDQVLFKPRFATDSLIIPVLVNDQLCKENKLLPLAMTVNPTGGSAYFNTKNAIIYKPNPSTTTDRIHYRRCNGPDCLDAIVNITIAQPDASCVLKANDNSIKLVLSQPTINIRRGIIPINVLANDDICVPLRSLRIKDNSTGANLQVISTGIINYTLETNPKAKELTFTYELVDILGKASLATVKISIKQ